MPFPVKEKSINMKSLLTLSLFCILISACTHDTVSPTLEVDQELASNYTHMEVGNFWVYDWYEIDPEGNSAFYSRDTLLVTGSVKVDGHTAMELTGQRLGLDFDVILFDSAQSVYTYPDRFLYFTLDSTTHHGVIGPSDSPLFTTFYYLEKEPMEVTVPAGTFECLNFQGKYVPQNKNYPYSTRYNDNLFAYKIGMVKMTTSYANSPNTLEGRLIAYGMIN